MGRRGTVIEEKDRIWYTVFRKLSAEREQDRSLCGNEAAEREMG